MNNELKYEAYKQTELGLITLPKTIVPKLRNIDATGELERAIDIERLASKLPNVLYEPEQFSGAIYHAEELEGGSVLIFASGKVVFAGLKSLELLQVARHTLEKLAQYS